MIRVEETGGWLLVSHRDHARLAGELARHWNNGEFAPPEPLADILVAVARHDDAWAERDEAPELTPEGRPAAISHEFVGSYHAPENPDLAGSLAMRGRATEAIAAENPYAAIIVSMHTVNLLAGPADSTGTAAADQARLRDFVAAQQARQQELAAAVAAMPGRAAEVEPARLQRACEFLEACDSLSLIACARHPKAAPLQHEHPRRQGAPTALDCLPLDHDTYRVAPYPFDADQLNFDVPCRRVRGELFADLNAFRAAFAAAPVEYLTIHLMR